MEKFSNYRFSFYLLACFASLFFVAPTIEAADLGVTIRFLGTDAADPGGWTTYGRQLSSILVGNDLLVDFSCWTNNANSGTGTCGLARLRQYGIDLNAINRILITHHHEDHFDPAQIVALAQARTSAAKMTLYGGITVVNGMNSYLSTAGKTGLINVIHLEPYAQAAVGPYTATPLIANHDTPGNEPYVYMIQYNGKQLFYGTDSGVLKGTSLAKIYATKFDLVIRERTFAVSEPDPAGAAHMDANKVAAERADWIAHGVITATTPYALTHIAFCRVGSCSIPAGTVDPGDGAYFPENYSPVGAFDYAGCSDFGGWTCDANDYAKPIDVHFYADGPAGSGTFVGSVTANSNREAAVGAQCGGNTGHGFYFATPAGLKDNKSHTIYAYSINTPTGNNPLIRNSPKTMQCACTNECASGAKQCSGNAVQTCGNYDTDTCFEWSLAAACGTGQTCAAGVCRCAAHSSKQCVGSDLYWYNSCGQREDLAQSCGVDSPTSNYKCNGSWVQRETIQKGCSGGACYANSAWNNSANCAASGKVCSNADCVAICTNECAAGAKQCLGNGVQTCAMSGGCLGWGAAVACAAGQICGNGVCKAGCIPKTCGSLGYECGSVSDGCGNTLNCGTCAGGKTCGSGKCIADCVAHAGKKCVSGKLYWYDSCNTREGLAEDCGSDSLTDSYRCDGNWTQRQTIIRGCNNDICVSVPVWNNIEECSSNGKICSEGTCKITCDDECTISGAKQCMENGYQTCRDDNGDGCLEWSKITACASGETCSAGTCSTPFCVPKTCGSLGYECGSVSDGCGKTLNCGGCGSGNVCSSGVCVAGSSSPKTLTRAEIIAKVGEIMALIAKLQEQLKAMTGSPSQNATANQNGKYSCAKITKNLYYGMKNDPEVKCLQEVLKAQGFAVVPTGDYGGITKAAVKQFQEKYASEILTPYGLKYGAGNVGNGTMAKMNALIGAN